MGTGAALLQNIAEAAVDGILRDKSKTRGIAPLDGELNERIVAFTPGSPGQEATEWTVLAVAKAVGIAASSGGSACPLRS